MAPGGDAYKVVPAGSGRFDWSRKELAEMNQDQMTDANKEALKANGGVEGVAAMLKVNLESGLVQNEEPDNFAERKMVFGANRYPEPPSASWFELYIDVFMGDLAMKILLGAVVVGLAVGIYEDLHKTGEIQYGWLEGAVIFIACQIVGVVSATNDYNKERQFKVLNAVKDEILVKVVRDGQQEQISTHDLVVGDVIYLEAGDKVPCDCLFVKGSDCQSNEASLTGEPDDLDKNLDEDPFLLSGCAITAGFCTCIAIAVGTESRWGRIKAKLAVEQPNTPLQDKLDDMVEFIGKVGMGFAVATFVAVVALHFAVESEEEESVTSVILGAFIIGVTIVVVAIPEGLPLAVTISLSYSTMKMLKDNNLIRVLAACETMGNATNICSDKTGTLTENRMTVVEGLFNEVHYDQKQGLPKADSVGATLTALLHEGIALNSSARLVINKEAGGRVETVGSKTEGALLVMIQNLGADYLAIRKEAEKAGRIEKVFMFSSARKMMSVLVKKADGGYRLYVKGASEFVLRRSIQLITAADGSTCDIDKAKANEIEALITKMADCALRTIGIAHRDFDELPDIDGVPPEECLTLQCVVGIIDPLRPDVPDAVKTCQDAGIMVRMVTGDNINTARAIAKDCGILTEGGLCLEGPAFRKLTPAELDEKLPNLQVLARSSPDDKHMLVTRLNGGALPKNQKEWEEHHPGRDWATEKDKLLPGYLEEWKKSREGKAGEVVGVTGDGTNDAPALKAGDVGLSMGLSGTEVAKEASDIVIMDDRFSSIVKAVLWGRCVFDNIRRFLQFQLTVNVVALLVTFIAALMPGYDLPLNAIMMLWVNLIMDTFGALALGTELPKDELLDRRPYKRDASLVNRVMWRNILVQSAFQIIMVLVLMQPSSAEMMGLVPGQFTYEYGPDCQGNVCPYPYWGTYSRIEDVPGMDDGYPFPEQDDGEPKQRRVKKNGFTKSWSDFQNSCNPPNLNSHNLNDTIWNGLYNTVCYNTTNVAGEAFTFKGDVTGVRYSGHIVECTGTDSDVIVAKTPWLEDNEPYSCDAPIYASKVRKDYRHYTVIFNAFVFCQIFNEFNARSITNQVNVFEGLFKNQMFMLVIVFSFLMQIFIVVAAENGAECSLISVNHWLLSIGIGVISLPLGVIMRFIPAPKGDDKDLAGYDPKKFKKVASKIIVGAQMAKN